MVLVKNIIHRFTLKNNNNQLLFKTDRKIYRREMLALTKNQQNLTIVEGEVVDLKLSGDMVSGIMLADGTTIHSKSVVLTSGTFLRGVIHIGDTSYAGGRMGDQASVRLAERIDDFNLPLGRLKTGTPPRLDGRPSHHGSPRAIGLRIPFNFLPIIYSQQPSHTSSNNRRTIKLSDVLESTTRWISRIIRTCRENIR